jgi:hypothetical protein
VEGGDETLASPKRGACSLICDVEVEMEYWFRVLQDATLLDAPAGTPLSGGGAVRLSAGDVFRAHELTVHEPR